MTEKNLEGGNQSDEIPKQEIESLSENELENFSVSELPVTVTPSAGPSKSSQFIAFSSILIGGLCGGLIGFAFTDLQCSGDCGQLSLTGGIIGAFVGAGGVGIVSILVLRATNEWKEKAQQKKGQKEIS